METVWSYKVSPLNGVKNQMITNTATSTTMTTWNLRELHPGSQPASVRWETDSKPFSESFLQEKSNQILK